MSQTRPIWNDGQGLATPDLQRGEDLVGSVDDRVYEVVLTPGSVQKKILPLLEESSSINPRLLAIPSSVGISGVNGAVRLQACELVAGLSGSAQKIALSGTLYAPLDTPAIASNSSGSTRYDLVYATLNRAVSTTGTRKIKSATDGSLSSQTINLADAPAISLGVNASFLTGATPPTTAQIAAAVPADTAPSSSTFGTFNFPIAYVTVANGYTSGTTLAQSSAGGTSFITQCWPGGAIERQRVRGPRPMSLYYGSANEKPSSSLSGGVQGAERWGSSPRQFFAHFKVVTATSSVANFGSGTTIDSSIDWRNRFVWGFYGYLGSASNLPLDSAAPAAQYFGFQASTQAGTNPVSVNLGNYGVLQMVWTGSGVSIGDQFAMRYTDGATFTFASMTVYTDGSLRLRRGNLIDGTNGDTLAVVLYATDQMLING